MRHLKRRNSFKKPFFVSKKNLLILGFSFFLSGMFLFFLKTSLLDIKDISVSGDVKNCQSDQKLFDSSLFFNKNFFLVNTEKIKNTIKQSSLCVGDVDVKKKFPNKIEIEIKTRKPVFLANVVKTKPPEKLDLIDATASSQTATLIVPSNNFISSEKFLVDDQGFFYSQNTNNSEDFPEIKFIDLNIKLGEFLPNETGQKLILSENKIKESGFEIKEAQVFSDFAVFKASPEIVVSFNKDILRQIASLQLILQKAKINSKLVDKIDLRFDKPVVVYSTKKN